MIMSPCYQIKTSLHSVSIFSFVLSVSLEARGLGGLVMPHVITPVLSSQDV